MTGIRVLGSIPLIKQSNIQFGSFDYGQLLVDTYGASEVWSLVDIESGTTIHAKVNSDRDGTLQGWDLQNADGPVSNTLAPYSDGTNDYGDIKTASLEALFDGDEGGVFIWRTMKDAGAWSGGNIFAFFARIDADNRVGLSKRGSPNDLRFIYEAGGTDLSFDDSSINGTLDWFSTAITWSASNDEVRGYVNGSKINTVTGLGTWVGATFDVMLIGAQTITPTFVHDGLLAYAAVRFGSRWSDDDILGMHNAATS